ncbi:hypothetical protein VTN02DRAFT_743 [Thermoascus thermophilus]
MFLLPFLPLCSRGLCIERCVFSIIDPGLLADPREASRIEPNRLMTSCRRRCSSPCHRPVSICRDDPGTAAKAKRIRVSNHQSTLRKRPETIRLPCRPSSNVLSPGLSPWVNPSDNQAI